jgi:hypothetical protein
MIPRWSRRRFFGAQCLWLCSLPPSQPLAAAQRSLALAQLVRWPCLSSQGALLAFF